MDPDSFTTTIVFLVLGLGVPLLLSLAIQLLGQKRGWTAKRIVKGAFLALWLWSSLMLMIATRIDAFGGFVIAAIVAILVFVAYKIATWGFKPVLDAYERSLASKRKAASGPPKLGDC